MSVELNSLKHPESLAAIKDELSEMARRLHIIISEPNPSQEILSEIVTIYSNVAHIFVYLEGNESHLDYELLLPQRNEFFKNLELYVRAYNLISRLYNLDSESEKVRQTWMIWFQEQSQAKVQTIDEKLEDDQQSAKHILYRTQENQAELLERLGVNTGIASPSTVFYQIVSNTKKLDTRRKIVQAWNMQQDRQTYELADILDQIIEVRRLQAKEKGFNTVLEQTFERCNISESKAHTFITEYLARALDCHSQLALNISKATECTDRPMDHFGYFVKSKLNGASLPVFSLDDCLSFVFAIANCVFDVTITPIERQNPQAVNVDVRSGPQQLGTISFDLLDTGYKHFSADSLPVTRSQSNSSNLVIKPAAHVLCRFQGGSDGTRLITFESVHSIFHEFGHALNHLLLRTRLPGRSGLNYLPVERLENLSSWFEKWVFHPDFASNSFFSRQDKKGLAQCQYVKMLEFQSTNLKRAVVAALDFDVHGRSEGRLRDSFEELDKQFSISDHCFFGDLLVHFMAPMFRANSGAGFVYLWGSAYGAQNFAPFFNLTVGEIQPHKKINDRFSSCFDPSELSTEPSIQAVFDFYNVVL
jgi:oligopeptidase A